MAHKQVEKQRRQQNKQRDDSIYIQHIIIKIIINKLYNATVWNDHHVDKAEVHRSIITEAYLW